jgi:type IV secretory pathway VirD2 relaxase
MHGRKRSGFTGARIGRGSGVARVLGARSGHGTGRRVVVKASIVRLGAKGLASATAHLRYLQRDGTTREGERGALYGPDSDITDGKAFLEQGAGDRHQFRFIVAPEDSAQYDDLKPLIRRWMRQVEQDLDTRLGWVAVDHFNTGHPHSHVVMRGKDERGKDLVIAREYLTQGLRARATELVELDLGPRSELEIRRSDQREITQERFTGIDRRLLAARDDDGLVRAIHRDAVEQSLRAGRLQTLSRLGLAEEVKRGSWKLDELERSLRLMGERGDIIRTMQRVLTERAPERPPADYAIYHPHAGDAQPIIGQVVARGLADEHAGSQYVIIDGVDGHSHYIDVGIDTAPTTDRSIVRVSPATIAPRQADRTIAGIAAVSGGRYTIDHHLLHDPDATEDFARTHERRLEAMRRAIGYPERESDGTWTIAPDHLDRVEAYERDRATRQPVVVETLSEKPLADLHRHEGQTWLDREQMSEQPVPLGRGFGADVRKAIDLRRQWLIEQQLAEIEGDAIRYRANLLSALQQRELRKVAGQLSSEMGLPFTATSSGDEISGVYRRAVHVGDAKFALIEKSREFTLVPWRPVLDRAVGKQVSGIMRDGGISWRLGRQRGIGIGM